MYSTYFYIAFFLYVYGDSVNTSNSGKYTNLYLFNQSTLKLAKVLTGWNWMSYYGFKTTQLNSDMVYWSLNNIIMRFYFNETDVYNQSFFRYNNDYINSIFFNTFVKETSNNNFIFSNLQFPNLKNSSTNQDVFIIGVDSDFNTNSCLTLSQIDGVSGLYYAPIGSDASSGKPIVLSNE